ncbi:MAG: hypothetical protein LCI00_20160 [Chloroflexi bacterium]|nr:hypothetical protein [Chloroflexota bacterium]MCC6893768.1 hypothetical protein [Anaerolineae bacterium]
MKFTPTINIKLPFFVGLILVLQNPVSAQEMMVVPDNSEIFTDAVEVLDSNIEYAYGNDLERELWTYLDDEGTWASFDYPEEFEDVLISKVNPDSTITLTVKEIGGTTDQRVLWWLDTASGIFSRYENACKDYLDRPDETTQPHWVFHKDEKLNRIGLCFSETGQSEYLLPNDLVWLNIAESPNAEWLILFGRSGDRNGSKLLQMHSYHVPTHEMIFIGELYREEYFRLEQWINPTEGIWYSAGMPEWSQKLYYYFDLRVPNSLKELEGRADLFDNPPRYEYLQTYYEILHRADLYGDYPDCEITTFDLSSKLIATYELGQDCYGHVLRVDESYYYASYPDNMAKSGLSIYRFDVNERLKTELVRLDELVALESVSPDGRYAFLILNDGTFPELRPNFKENPTGYPPVQELDPFYYDAHLVQSSRVGFYNLELQKWVYPPTNETFGGAVNGIISELYWIDDNHFYIQSATEAVAFSLGETGLTEISRIKGRVEPSPDKHHVLIWNEDSTLELVNLLSGERQQLAIFPQGFPPYSPSLEWVGQDEFVINSTIRFDESYDKRLTMTYHVRILDNQ